MTVNFYETHDELVNILYTELFAIYIVALSFTLFTKENSYHFHGIRKLRIGLWTLAAALTIILINNVFYDDPLIFFIGHVLTLVGNTLILIAILNLHLAEEKPLIRFTIAVDVLLTCFFFYFTLIDFSFQNIALLFHLKRLFYVVPLIYVLQKYRIEQIKENYFWLQLFLLIIAVFSMILSYKIFSTPNINIFEQNYVNNELFFDIIDFSYLGFYVGIVYLLYSHSTILIQELADFDHLTKVFNRRAFLNHVSQSKVPYSLAFFDIDYFKQINDKHGHDAGDEALRHLSIHLKEHFKDKGILGRFGGEEFIVFMKNTGIEEATALCDGFRKRIETNLLHYQNRIIPFTVSGGVVYALKYKSLQDSISKADECMYRAKKSGRNRIITLPLMQ